MRNIVKISREGETSPSIIFSSQCLERPSMLILSLFLYLSMLKHDFVILYIGCKSIYTRCRDQFENNVKIFSKSLNVHSLHFNMVPKLRQFRSSNTSSSPVITLLVTTPFCCFKRNLSTKHQSSCETQRRISPTIIKLTKLFSLPQTKGSEGKKKIYRPNTTLTSTFLIKTLSYEGLCQKKLICNPNVVAFDHQMQPQHQIQLSKVLV